MVASRFGVYLAGSCSGMARQASFGRKLDACEAQCKAPFGVSIYSWALGKKNGQENIHVSVS